MKPTSKPGRALKRAQHVVEYASARALLAVVRRIPLRSAMAMARGFAGLTYLLMPARRGIACDNIRRTGVASDPREVNRIARESFRHFGMLAVETVRFVTDVRAEERGEAVEADLDPEVWACLQDPARGAIIACGHLGNWEVGARYLSRIKPVVGIAQRMSNPYTDRLREEFSFDDRFRLTPKHGGGSMRFVSVLKRGEALAVLIDQHGGTRGLPTEFFGTETPTHTVAARLHRLTGSPICFGYCIRTGLMRFKLTMPKPIVRAPTDNKAEDVRAIIEMLNRELEQAIRQHPDQYLWAHRRWR